MNEQEKLEIKQSSKVEIRVQLADMKFPLSLAAWL